MRGLIEKLYDLALNSGYITFTLNDFWGLAINPLQCQPFMAQSQ